MYDYRFSFFFFFFQAEDGIRDGRVTGVQTCALPISDLTQKILNERRAGKYFADLLMGGSSSFVVFPAGALERLRPQLVLRSEERRVGKECRSRWAREP